MIPRDAVQPRAVVGGESDNTVRPGLTELLHIHPEPQRESSSFVQLGGPTRGERVKGAPAHLIKLRDGRILTARNIAESGGIIHTADTRREA